MTRHPSENFIKFLMTCSHPHAGNNEWVQNMVVSLGYPPPDTDYLIWLRGDVLSRMPAGFNPSDRFNRPSVQFARRESIYGLHVQDKPAQEANLIVTNLRTRPLIEDLLLGRVEVKEIAKKVNARLTTHYTADGIDAYRNYYWQVSLLKVEDWSKLLEQYEHQRANALAIVQVGPSMALHKAGFQQQIDSKSMLRTMQETLYFDFMEWKTKPHGEKRTKAMAAIARTNVLVDVQLSQADNAMKDSLKAFENFRMQHAQATVPGMQDLAPDGNYTGSGARLLEAKTASEDDDEEAEIP